MFLKNVEGTYVNLLGADVIMREDKKDGVSRFVVRHGQHVTNIGVFAHDVPGTPRREAFEIVERFLEKLALVPASMSAEMWPADAKPDQLDWFRTRIDDLERERDSMREREVKYQDRITDLGTDNSDLRRELASSRMENEMTAKTRKELQAEKEELQADLVRARGSVVTERTTTDRDCDPDIYGY